MELRAPRKYLQWRRRSLDRVVRTRAIDRFRPADTVCDHLEHVVVVIGRVGLVAGAEVEDLAGAALVAATAAEDLAAGKPTDEDQGVRLRDVEMLAVHLLLGD